MSVAADLETTGPDSAVEGPDREVGNLPAWPILVMLWGFPAMWLLGVTVIPAALSMTFVMVVLLCATREITILPGVGVFTAFVLWIVPTAVMLDGTARALGFVYRFSIVAFALVAFVYTISAWRQLTFRSVVNGLAFVWLFVVVGGILGMLFPTTRLSTPVGVLMPAWLTSNPYVHDLFFPPFAEIQHPYGSPTAFLRPSAPFPYANSWGVAILILTPVAVAAFILARTWWTRVVLLLGAVGMVPAAMASSNRGMFVALGLSAAYIWVRQCFRNRAVPVIAIGSIAIATVLFLVSRGLFDQLAQRQQYGQSTESRFTLYAETIRRTMDSPLLGYGAPRPSTAQDLSVGTQGYVWTLMFSFGFIGLALFLLFLWGTTIRTWRAPSDVELALHSSLVVASAAVFVYGLDIMQMLALMLVSALLLRRRYGLDHNDVDP
jgi:hypothetical protein